MSDSPTAPFLIAAVQATPVFLNRAASLEKAAALIAATGRAGAKLAVFPEGFIPTYPLWAWFIPPYKTQELRELYTELLENAVAVPSRETDQLCAAAAAAGVNVVMGVNERNVEASTTTLYNTLLFIGSDGRLLGKHRKLIPTVAERMIHAQGDGSTLRVYDLPIGRLAGLICWENYMPLARYAMYAWGTQIYVAATWDHGEPWLSTLRHIAKEGRAYVIGVCMPLRVRDIPDRFEFKGRFYGGRDWINSGDSAVAGPDGNFIAGPVSQREEIVYAEVDLTRLKNSKWMLDVAGHYGRPDVFQLTVNRAPSPMISEDGRDASGRPGARVKKSRTE